MPKGKYFLKCSKCGIEKEAVWVIGSRTYAAQRLDVPYFVCSDCRLICLDRTSLSETIKWWKELNPSKHIPSQGHLYREMFPLLDRVVQYYCDTAGYKRARFKKVHS